MIEEQPAYYRSPVGTLEIIGSEDGISAVAFVDPVVPDLEIPGCLTDCVSQLEEYFSGARKAFSLQLDLQGTEFQKRVWRELLKIPFGKTVSYLDIAIALGNRKAIRAVGGANGQNPIAIIVPCHRVIGANGSLTGYGGGLWRKEWLLNFENSLPQANLLNVARMSDATR